MTFESRRDNFRVGDHPFPISLPHNTFLDIVGHDPPSLLRQVQCWIVREEIDRYEIELVPQYGHHRPSLTMPALSRAF